MRLRVHGRGHSITRLEYIRCFLQPFSCRSSGDLVAGWLMLAALIAPGVARADVVAPNANSHGTEVTNGTAGDAVVDGGVLRGNNLFQRLQKFDTTPLNKVNFLTKSNKSQVDLSNPILVKNLFLSVLEPALINKAVNVESQAGFPGVNFYLLSPMGITISGAGTFTGVNTLLLTTSKLLYRFLVRAAFI